MIIELNGPSVAEPTSDTQPTFTFLGGSIIPVHFDCGFDGAARGRAAANAPIARRRR